ncbi:MAG: endopeptidase La [Desulfuromonadia bacterium]
MPEQIQSITIPEAVPLHPLKEMVAFPYMVATLYIREEDLPPFEETVLYNSLIAMVRVRDEGAEGAEGIEGLAPVGTLCRVTRINRLSDGGAKITFEGLCRVTVTGIVADEPVRLVSIDPIREFTEKTMVSEALISSLNALLKIALSYGRPLPDDVMKMLDYIENPARLADLVTLYINLPLDEQQLLLETTDPIERLKKVYMHLTAEVQKLQVKSEIQAEVTKKVGKTQKEYILREQMKHIQEELGDEDPRTADINELRKKIEASGMPPDVRKVADRELKRLERINQSSPDYNVTRTYLDYLAGMPWKNASRDNNDITQAEAILNEDHYDMEKVKERILEFLAVRSLKESMKGPILCFVGPPGVGKTSLGKSIAKSLGRKFIRQSLGGMRDEAEIRGHRRTYIGALPGRVVMELYRCGTNNPVFMLDEVDKIGSDFRGDPASALLEVLDPEQNSTFTDHYLDVPFDLSNVMFITTANQLDPIPAPLRDRMEVIRLSGYTTEEKMEIARKYLIPKEIEENGLSGRDLCFTDESILAIITDHTREAGVRTLQRTIGSVCRKIAKEITQGKPLRTPVTPEMVTEFLGPAKFINDVAAEDDRIGVVTGLAWTEVGGDIIFIEASSMKGKGELILTGSLGEVMKESARAALSFVQANAGELGISAGTFDDRTIHIHVPAGSIPKDGPSAGVTMVTALVSLLSGRPARRDVAMTGEISLTGRVLPIGGVKEKALAARRAGVKTLILPERNRKDLEEIPQQVKDDLTIVFIDDVREAITITLA